MANICRTESVLGEFVEAQDYAAINCRRNKQKSWNKITELLLIRCPAIHRGPINTIGIYPPGAFKNTNMPLLD